MGGSSVTSAWVCLLAGAAVLAACGNSDDKKAASQVAATVNSEEITVHQVNNVLARNPSITPEAAPRAKREIVERLIDQELARQQALERKLDRSPSVVQAIEAAKTEILARAYFQEVAAAQAKPTPAEVKKYYAEHPELFSQRRLYVLEEIAVASKDGIAAELRERAAKAKSMQEIADWLKAREVQYAVDRGGRAAEQIPLEMLPRLQKMKDGDIEVIEASGRLNVIRVVATKTDPIDETAAAPRIQQFLFNQRSSEVIAEEMKRLKERARIEYVGEFATASPSSAKPAAAAAAPKEAASPAASIEKGVRGLR
jgi:EpsD family peptidyl-prolyl cis-trans isomerase